MFYIRRPVSEPPDDITLNIAIRNLADSDSENTLNKVNALIKDCLRLRNSSCHKAVRKPARGDNQNGVVIATCGCPDDKREIMQNKSKPKDKRQYERVYIEHDRSPAERKQISNLRKLVNVAGRDPLRVQGSRVVFAQQDEDRNNNEYNSRVRDTGNTRYAQSDNNREYPRSRKPTYFGYTRNTDEHRYDRQEQDERNRDSVRYSYDRDQPRDRNTQH